MHEQTETIQRPNGKWINVYGLRTSTAGRPTPPKFPYERAEYDTLLEAVEAAKRRSLEPESPLDLKSNLPRGAPVKGAWGDVGYWRQLEAIKMGKLRGVSPRPSWTH